MGVTVNLSPSQQKSKQKKPIKIASASWHVWLKNRISDFFGILIFWYTTQLGREEFEQVNWVTL